MKEHKIVRLKVSDQLLDIVIHEKDNLETIFAIDKESLHSIDPVSHESNNILTLDFREHELTTLAGRYSASQQSFMLYIGDTKGILRVFDPVSMLIQQEI